MTVKLDRAKGHLDDFDAQVAAIEAACRKATALERDESRAEHVVRIRDVPVVPPAISGILGDAIHNLRTCLDHLAWELVLANGKEPPAIGRRGTAFPILHKVPQPDHWGRSRPEIRPGLPDELRDILDEVQPYKRLGSADHPLAILNALDISDKHHKLLVAIVGVVNVGWFGEFEMTSVNTGPYEAGDEICRFTAGDEHSDGQLDPVVGFTVRLEEPAAGSMRRSLGAGQLVRRSLSYIEDEVLPRFRDFL